MEANFRDKDCDFTELKRRERRRIKQEPHVFSLPMGTHNFLPHKGSLKFRGGDSIDDLGVISYNGSLDLLARTMLLNGSPRRLHLR